MYNRCSRHRNEGGIPVRQKNRVFCMHMTKQPLLVAISLLILLLETTLAAAPKYETAYACEGKTLAIECDPGYLISLIRANYGRFSIAICNDHGNVEWSVNCMAPKSLRVLHSKCAHKQNCSVLASTNMFGDPCPGTHKYLEAHYQCISASQTSTTTNRPSPPWLLTSTLPTSNVAIVPTAPSVTTARFPTLPPNTKTHFAPGKLPTVPLPGSNGGGSAIHLAGGRAPMVHTKSESENTTDKVQRPTASSVTNADSNSNDSNANTSSSASSSSSLIPLQINATKTVATIPNHLNSSSNSNNSRKTLLGGKNNHYDGVIPDTIQSTVLGNNNHHQDDHDRHNVAANANDNKNGGRTDGNGFEGNNLYCGATTARNLFWNVTRVGEVNVQPCPGGATGIAKWRCMLMHRQPTSDDRKTDNDSTSDVDDCHRNTNSPGCDSDKQKNIFPTWHPQTPDLTQCRSLWLNSLEVGVNQRDSSLISIANDLSQVTSSKTLYGGDMLVTTKIIQTMSEKMSYDIETFPDQRQREAIIYELLHGVVKTGSNLLDDSQHLSWLDLSFEDQMRVATSLLTGLEDNAFLLADTIIRERSVMQKVKNILLSVRVLETVNIAPSVVFPDGKLEQWTISDDRIELPRAALIENSEGGLVRIVFVAFDRLESILKPSYNNLDLNFFRNYDSSQNAVFNDSYSMQRIRILNSKVISASLGKGRHIQLSQPIKLILRHLKTENVSNPTCVFWNYIDHAWSADGCYLESTNRTHSICMCNHLTNFAILMDVIDEHSTSLLSMFDSNMRILMYISIAICILFIIIAILTLKLFNGVFIKSTRASLYKNIYVCLFIIEILFLLGIEQSESSLLCGFTTIFLHCFILSAIAWLCFEGFQAYVTLTTDDMLLEVESSSKIIGYYLLSYGLSLTIVAISLAIDPATYTQNDFCVLMEANMLFYMTFLAPIVLFVLGAIIYTILACIIMFKKNNSTIKNKEHTRLSNVRFDIRCSIVFLLALLADWVFAYFYLRKAKNEDESANTYGYLFIVFNSLLGIYIFIFHCIQNEKIRREYRKYIRQNSWLPKCLRCSKASSISSSNISHHNHHPHYSGGTASTSKKSPIPNETDHVTENIIAASGGGGVGGGSALSTPKTGGDSGVLAGTLHHIKNNAMMGSMAGIPPGHIILERAAGGTLKTPSAGHTSPTSSVSSTNLIFNSKQIDPQSWNYHQQPEYYATSRSGSDNKNFNTYDDKFLYYDTKSKRIKSGYPMATTTPRNMAAAAAATNGLDGQFQQHEYFYWTEKNPNQKKLNGDLKTSHHKSSDAMHTFYPSYKKTTTLKKPKMMAAAAATAAGVDGGTDDEFIADADRKYLQHHHHHRYPSKSSDDDHCDSSTRHLMPLADGGALDGGVGVPEIQPYHQTFRQRGYNRGGEHEFSLAPNGSYYNQGTAVEEPVYEEILNSRMSEMCDDDADGDDDEEEEEDDEEERNLRGGGGGGRRICSNKGQTDEDVENMIIEEEKYNRIRRMIANKDENFKRQRFLRQDQPIAPSGFGQVEDFFPPPPPPSHASNLIARNFEKSPSRDDRGPPLPQMHPHQRQYTLQQQKMHQQQQQLQQFPVGRNISAMLDGNNTVVCYLEPLPK